MHHIIQIRAKSFRQRRTLPSVKNILLPPRPMALLLCVFVVSAASTFKFDFSP